MVETPAWVRDAVFYQVFPDRLARSGRVAPPGEMEPWDDPPSRLGFKGGDLYGVIEHLDRLERLGIDALYLNPVFTSASNHRYHTDDYWHVDPLLGGDPALRALLDEAHTRGMRVILDGVFNHCGRGFWPFHHVLENGLYSPYRDWFHLHEDVRSGRLALTPFPADEHLERMEALRGEGVERGLVSATVLGYTSWWDLPALPKLALDEPHMRAMILDVAEHWTRFGIDGWRLDVADEIGPEFWRVFRERVRGVNPEAYLVAEVWSPMPEWLQGDMFDAFMNYPLTKAVLGFAAQGRLDLSGELPEGYRGQSWVFDGPELWRRIEELRSLHDPAVNAAQLNLLGSHDTPRLRTLCGGDLDAVRIATLLQMTLPGAPCVYYGDEIGMEGGMDPECRAGFPLDAGRWEDPPRDWLADLIAVRRSSRALRDGELALLRAEGAALAYLRRDGTDVFACIVNAADGSLSWDIALPLAAGSAEVMVLHSEREARARATVQGPLLQVEVPARHGAIVRLSDV